MHKDAKAPGESTVFSVTYERMQELQVLAKKCEYLPISRVFAQLTADLLMYVTGATKRGEVASAPPEELALSFMGCAHDGRDLAFGPRLDRLEFLNALLEAKDYLDAFIGLYREKALGEGGGRPRLESDPGA